MDKKLVDLVKQLIEKSAALSPEQKEVYNGLLFKLNEKELKELGKILLDEQKAIKKANLDEKKRVAEINRKYIEELPKFLRKEEMVAMDEEEAEERKDTAKILEKLDDV